MYGSSESHDPSCVFEVLYSYKINLRVNIGVYFFKIMLLASLVQTCNNALIELQMLKWSF